MYFYKKILLQNDQGLYSVSLTGHSTILEGLLWAATMHSLREEATGKSGSCTEIVIFGHEKHKHEAPGKHNKNL